MGARGRREHPDANFRVHAQGGGKVGGREGRAPQLGFTAAYSVRLKSTYSGEMSLVNT
ncbi:hypothetical protein BH23VER1_BH23VER1_30400 [soil metagenome]